MITRKPEKWGQSWVKVRKNTFRCFVCGAHGGPIDLVMKYLNKPFRDACRWLADENCIILSDAEKCTIGSVPLCTFDASRYERFFERPWLSDEARRFLFEERRIDPRVVRWCRLTSWKDSRGVPWLQIPYYDRENRLTGLQNRNLVSGAAPRFRFPQGAECSIYNLPVLNLLKPADDLYITEGSSDCWAMLSAGHKAIAIPSATLLKPRDADLLSDLHNRLSIRLHMYPDNDTAGERLFLQLRQHLPTLQHHHLPPGCKDFSDYYLLQLTGGLSP